jgi:sugar O-acyltransferase (sialic acid O-acetyltransferase NeuD family)
MAIPLQVPRLNSNEDQVLVVKLHVQNDDQVEEGALLLEVETTKATAEFRAPAAGRVVDLVVDEGQFVDVGQTIGSIATEAAAPTEVEIGAALPSPPKISAKAKKLAAQYGLDLAVIPARDGRVTGEDVEAAYRRAAGPGQLGGGPAVPALRAVIFGGGGHAAVVLEALQGQGYEIVGCVDDDQSFLGSEVLGGTHVIGSRDLLPGLVDNGVAFAFIGVGGALSSEAREDVFRDLAQLGFRLPPVIHPRAYVSASSRLGAATLVLPGAVVGPRCRIGANVIVNQGAQICHDSIVEDGCHVTPGAVIAGGCRIGSCTVIGMTAAIMLGTSVGRECLIHNGAAVNTDVPDRTEVRRDGSRIVRPTSEDGNNP